MTPTDDITLPDGSVVEVPANTTALALGFGALTVHRHAARLRTIERWRDKTVFSAARDAIADECQELENAYWNILLARYIDDAYGEGLNVLGRIVDEPRDGQADPSYRARIRARIRVNQSQGLAPDLLAVAVILEPTNTFTLTWTPPAAYVLALDSPPSGFATGTEFANMIAEATGAGIGGLVVMPADGDPFVLGDTGGVLETSTLGDTGGVLVTSLADGRAA